MSTMSYTDTMAALLALSPDSHATISAHVRLVEGQRDELQAAIHAHRAELLDAATVLLIDAAAITTATTDSHDRSALRREAAVHRDIAGRIRREADRLRAAEMQIAVYGRRTPRSTT